MGGGRTEEGANAQGNSCVVCAGEAGDGAEVAPCGCAVCAECLEGLPRGLDALRNARILVGILRCEAHGLPLMDPARRVTSMGPVTGELELHVLFATALAAASAAFTARHAPDISAGLQGLVLAGESAGVTVGEVALQAARVLETYRYAVCDAEGCGKGFFFVGGCSDVESGKFSRCFKCESELECAWDAGVFRCANPTCRRWLLREASARVGVAQCNATGCVCMDFATKAVTDTGELAGVTDDEEIHDHEVGTCARCHGLCASAGAFYPLLSRDHWRSHLFQRGARVTLPAEYVYNATGKINPWVRARDRLSHRMVATAERHPRFPGYCGCHELQAVLAAELDHGDKTLEGAERRLADVLRKAGPLARYGARVDWVDHAGDQDDGAVAMPSLMRQTGAMAAVARVQREIDSCEAVVMTAWSQHARGQLFDFVAVDDETRRARERVRLLLAELKRLGLLALAREYEVAFRMRVIIPLRTLCVLVKMKVVHSHLRTPVMPLHIEGPMAGFTQWERAEVFRAEQRAVARVGRWTGSAATLTGMGYRPEVQAVVNAHVQVYDQEVMRRLSGYLPLVRTMWERLRGDMSAEDRHCEAWRAQMRGALMGALPCSEVPNFGAVWLEVGALFELGILVLWTLQQMLTAVTRGGSATLHMSHDVMDDCFALISHAKAVAESHQTDASDKLLGACVDAHSALMLALLQSDAANGARRVRRRLQ